METVKNLMVGEDTNLDVVVDETTMYGLIYRCKANLEAFQLVAGKDVAQALILFCAVGQYI